MSVVFATQENMKILSEWTTTSRENVETIKDCVKFVIEMYENCIIHNFNLNVIKTLSNDYILDVIFDDTVEYKICVQNSGKLEYVTQYKEFINERPVLKKMSELVNFPILIDNGKYKYKLTINDKNLYINGNKVKINVYDCKSKYCCAPFLDEKDNKRNQIMLLPHYNKNDLYACLMCKYNKHGFLNLAIAYIDVKNNILHEIGTYFYSYPWPQAFVKNPDNSCDIIYTLDTINVLYKNDMCKINNWSSLYHLDDREKIDCFEYFSIIDKFMIDNDKFDYIKNLISQYISIQEKFPQGSPKCIEIITEILNYPEYKFISMDRYDSELYHVYNLACQYALIGNVEKTVELLESVKEKIEHAQKLLLHLKYHDEALNPIRENVKFIEFISELKDPYKFIKTDDSWS